MSSFVALAAEGLATEDVFDLDVEIELSSVETGADAYLTSPSTSCTWQSNCG
ncbi:FDLD family class I lanthipeptide [Streptomyces sp. x-80]|uniref:FDLD family class I lanthipeptide n=1 Tax=Streptomyces sp. x-80 TaxID=2789282 RepID=UPI00397EA6E1